MFTPMRILSMTFGKPQSGQLARSREWAKARKVALQQDFPHATITYSSPHAKFSRVMGEMTGLILSIERRLGD
jgi:hypothetical protein